MSLLNDNLANPACVEPSNFASLRFEHYSNVKVPQAHCVSKRLRTWRKEPSHWHGASYSRLSLLYYRALLSSGPTLLSGILMDPMWNIYDKLLVYFDKISNKIVINLIEVAKQCSTTSHSTSPKPIISSLSRSRRTICQALWKLYESSPYPSTIVASTYIK